MQKESCNGLARRKFVFALAENLEIGEETWHYLDKGTP